MSATEQNFERLRVEPPTWRRRIRLALLVADASAIMIALVAGVFARFGGTEVSVGRLSYTWLGLLIGVMWLATLVWMQCYNTDYLGVGNDEFVRVLRASFLVFGSLAIVAVAFRWQIARGFLAIAFPLGVLLLELERLVARRMLIARRRRGRISDRVMVVGSPGEVRYVVDAISRVPETGYRVVAVNTGGTDAEFELADGSSLPEVGSLADKVPELVDGGIATVVVAGQARMSRRDLRALSWQLEDSPVRLVVASSMTDVAGPRIHWRPVEGLPLMSVEMPQYSGAKYALKRAFDLVVSIALLVVLSPILLVVALAIKLDDGGPVFFRQPRVGVNGEVFMMTKFRSMVIEAESLLSGLREDTGDAGNGRLFKMRVDPRITRVGGFIRRYSIDELPQLFDVVAGKMSLVGPRPPLQSEVATYEFHVRRRLNVKPGMTGLWQVGGRSNLTWDESVRKDLYYVENWSLAGDIVILFKTLRAVVGKDGAY